MRGNIVEVGQQLIKVVPDKDPIWSKSSNTNKSLLQNAEKNKSKILRKTNNFSTRLWSANLTIILQNLIANKMIWKFWEGSVAGSSAANTIIRATVSGTILEIPVKLGDQVIAANNFNDTSVAIIADLNEMILRIKLTRQKLVS